jgi:hypothetical protein
MSVLRWQYAQPINTERQNPIKGKKMHGMRDFCPVFASFVRAGHERFMSPKYHPKLSGSKDTIFRHNITQTFAFGEVGSAKLALLIPVLFPSLVGEEKSVPMFSSPLAGVELEFALGDLKLLLFCSSERGDKVGVMYVLLCRYVAIRTSRSCVNRLVFCAIRNLKKEGKKKKKKKIMSALHRLFNITNGI